MSTNAKKSSFFAFVERKYLHGAKRHKGSAKFRLSEKKDFLFWYLKKNCIFAQSNYHLKENNMSTKALSGLLEYLYGTLSINNMRWVGEHLIEHAKKEEEERLRPYTMEEIDDMLDEAEAAFEAGEYLSQDEVFHHEKNTMAENAK